MTLPPLPPPTQYISSNIAAVTFKYMLETVVLLVPHNGSHIFLKVRFCTYECWMHLLQRKRAWTKTFCIVNCDYSNKVQLLVVSNNSEPWRSDQTISGSFTYDMQTSSLRKNYKQLLIWFTKGRWTLLEIKVCVISWQPTFYYINFGDSSHPS